MPAKLRKAYLLPLLLLSLPLLTLPGCGTKELPSYYPPPTRPACPSIPGRVPPTQRPYTVNGKTYYPLPSACGYVERGIASWYGPRFHGKMTSDGEVYNMYGLTAAHKILPMNTMVLVKNLDNSREAVLRVNDRGPFVKDRVIDLSLGAARALGLEAPGTAHVVVTALGEAQRPAGGGAPRFVAYQNLSEGEFFVQLGAFTSRENAERLKAEMQGRGLKAMSEVYERGDGCRFYRVQVWAGRTLDQARLAARSWEKRYPNAFVVAR